MKIRSNGPVGERQRLERAPTRTSTTPSRPAARCSRARPRRASASTSSVTSRPSAGMRAGEPDRAVAAERADLQDRAGRRSPGPAGAAACPEAARLPPPRRRRRERDRAPRAGRPGSGRPLPSVRASIRPHPHDRDPPRLAGLEERIRVDLVAPAEKWRSGLSAVAPITASRSCGVSTSPPRSSSSSRRSASSAAGPSR